jgi:hypothetical protein
MVRNSSFFRFRLHPHQALPQPGHHAGVVSIYEGSWCSDDQGRPVPGSANYLPSTLGTEESISCVMHGIPVRLRLPGSA